MVQKVLHIVLVLLWTMPLFMAKYSMKTKYIVKQQINYGEEDKIINKLLSCTELECNECQTDKDSAIALSRSKWDAGIQYRRQPKDEVKGFIPKLVAYLNMVQFTNCKSLGQLFVKILIEHLTLNIQHTMFLTGLSYVNVLWWQVITYSVRLHPTVEAHQQWKMASQHTMPLTE